MREVVIEREPATLREAASVLTDKADIRRLLCIANAIEAKGRFEEVIPETRFVYRRPAS